MLSIKEYVKHPALLGEGMLVHFGQWLPDSTYLKLMFRLKMGSRLNLKNPRTFSEKLQWLKLYNRRSQYTTMVDKYAVKEYVAGIIGEEYIIPTIGVWDKPEDIDWETLPNQFVLKTTHGGGSTGVVICKDKTSFDKSRAINKLNESLKIDIYRLFKEWPYKNVPKRVIAEKYIEPRPDIKDLPDYKFFCFDGEVKALFIATDRQKEGEDVKFDFFDADFNHLPFKQGHENANPTPQKPCCFEQMKKAAAMLSKGLPQARIDFYDIGDCVLFGEITFFHFSGLMPFSPEEWDKTFGDMLMLPGEKRGGVIINELQNGEIVFSKTDLPDYKFFCFNGVPKYCQVIGGRNTTETIDFFDLNWEHQPFHEPRIFPHSNPLPQRPQHFELMLGLARKLAEDKPFSRIDFYDVNERVLFGEITFYPTSGMGGFDPEDWDKKFGDLIKLPNKYCNC